MMKIVANPYAALRISKKAKKETDLTVTETELNTDPGHSVPNNLRCSKKESPSGSNRHVNRSDFLKKSFFPTTSNVIRSDYGAMIGLRSNEGACLVACIKGTLGIMNFKLSEDKEIMAVVKSKSDVQMAFSILFYPCFSPKTNSLLVIESCQQESQHDMPIHTEPDISKNTVPEFSKSSDENCNGKNHGQGNVNTEKQKMEIVSTVNEGTEILRMARKLLHSNEQFESILYIKDLSFTHIQSIEQMMPMYRGIFRGTEISSVGVQGFYPTSTMDNRFVSTDSRTKQIEKRADMMDKKVDAIETKSLSFSSWEPSLTKCIKEATALHVYAVVGSKNTGKSTFARLLVNGLLSRFEQVMYLDSDVGQCEFTPSGFVTLTKIDSPLLGPSFTHLKVDAIQSIPLGMNSPFKNPDLYLQSIRSLFQTYQDYILHHGPIPLIVNTHGWTKGMGFDLLTFILTLFNPSTTFCLDSKEKDSLYEALRSSLAALSGTTSDDMTNSNQNSKKVTPMKMERIESLGEGVSKFNAADIRLLSVLCYFAQRSQRTDMPVLIRFPADSSTCSSFTKVIAKQSARSKLRSSLKPLMGPWWNFEEGILSKVPFCCLLNEISVCFPFDQVPEEEIVSALNSTMVAFCVQRDSTKERSLHKESDPTDTIIDNTDAIIDTATNTADGTTADNTEISADTNKAEYRNDGRMIEEHNENIDTIPKAIVKSMSSSFPDPSQITKSYLCIIRGIVKLANGHIQLLVLSNGSLGLNGMQDCNLLIGSSDFDIPGVLYVKGNTHSKILPYTSLWTVNEGIGSSSLRARRNLARRRLGK